MCESVPALPVLHGLVCRASVGVWCFSLPVHDCCLSDGRLGRYVTEGAFLLGGLGFNGVDVDGTPKWDRMAHVHILGVRACVVALRCAGRALIATAAVTAWFDVG